MSAIPCAQYFYCKTAVEKITLPMHFRAVVLLIKSKINEGAVSTVFPMIDLLLKRVSERFFLFIYLFSFLFFAFLAITAIGLSCENKIQVFTAGKSIAVINFIQYPIILILLSLFLKMSILPKVSNEQALQNTAKLYLRNPHLRVRFLQKAIFYQGFGFRVFITSLFVIPFAIFIYFDGNIVFNIAIAMTTMACAVLLLNSLEVLLYYLSSTFKINSSIFTITMFVVGFVVITSFDNLIVNSLTPIFTTITLLISISVLIMYFIKKHL